MKLIKNILKLASAGVFAGFVYCSNFLIEPEDINTVSILEPDTLQTIDSTLIDHIDSLENHVDSLEIEINKNENIAKIDTAKLEEILDSNYESIKTDVPLNIGNNQVIAPVKCYNKFNNNNIYLIRPGSIDESLLNTYLLKDEFVILPEQLEKFTEKQFLDYLVNNIVALPIIDSFYADPDTVEKDSLIKIFYSIANPCDSLLLEVTDSKETKLSKEETSGFFEYTLGLEDSSRSLFFLLTAYNQQGKKADMLHLPIRGISPIIDTSDTSNPQDTLTDTSSISIYDTLHNSSEIDSFVSDFINTKYPNTAVESNIMLLNNVSQIVYLKGSKLFSIPAKGDYILITTDVNESYKNAIDHNNMNLFEIKPPVIWKRTDVPFGSLKDTLDNHINEGNDYEL